MGFSALKVAWQLLSMLSFWVISGLRVAYNSCLAIPWLEVAYVSQLSPKSCLYFWHPRSSCLWTGCLWKKKVYSMSIFWPDIQKWFFVKWVPSKKKSFYEIIFFAQNGDRIVQLWPDELTVTQKVTQQIIHNMKTW